MAADGDEQGIRHSAKAEARHRPQPLRHLATSVRREMRALKVTFPRPREILPFLGYVARRFADDRCPRMAAGLGYTSLLAVVPLTAIAFSMLAAFPVFEGMRERFQDILFANLLPQSAEAMREYFSQFVAKSAALSAVGIVGLAFTAVLLLGTIEADMNAIFRVTRPRRLAARLLVFWAVITLGPLLLGASFSLSTYLFAAGEWLGVDDPAGPIAQAAPTVIIVVMLTFFYLVIPNRPVRLSASLLGGVVAGLMFSGLRELFGWYVSNFPAYQTIYGALSVIPIFLVWLYLSWIVVLLGAVLAASLTEWRDAGGRPIRTPLATGPRLATALRVLGMLHARSQRGGSVSRAKLLRSAEGGDAVLDAILNNLRDGGFIDEASRGGWVLSRDLASATLYDLYQALGLAFSERDIEMAERGWEGKVAETLRQVREDNKDRMQVPIRSLLADEIGDATTHQDDEDETEPEDLFEDESGPPSRAAGD